jgi:D-alanyl-lipoteichoic acid acyltransferase DltB (MBOAT superfamily)
MLFNSVQFGVFFAMVLVAFVASPRRYRTSVLLGASLSFYALWVPAYLVLLLGTLSVNFLLTKRMSRSPHPRRYLVASVAITLSLLAVFKYAAFGVELATPFVRRALDTSQRIPELVLPLGISFYSFEIVSLSVDVYRGRRPCPSFARYLLFVTFFPHLIAGPIMRGGELLPQLDAGGERTPERTRRGLWLFFTGLAKKTVFADFLLSPFANDIFSAPGSANAPSHLVAAYSFAFQIYFDFSGYTDMARGLSCLLGFELPMNFEEPYLSRSPSEFWRRWHMTLSRWLRDYLYVPLGGNRRGPARTTLNLMLTMLLGGLWHGAGLNFVVWGGLHGVLLVVARFRRRPGDADRALTWSDAPRIFALFNVVCLIWVPFRCETWADAVAFARGLVSSGYSHGWPLLPTAIVGLCFVLHVVERRLRERLPVFHAKLATAAWGPLLEGGLFGAVVMLSVLSSGAGAEFIYYQF